MGKNFRISFIVIVSQYLGKLWYSRVVALILVKIFQNWDIKDREQPLISQQGAMFTHISAITLLSYSYRFLVSFSVLCSIKKVNLYYLKFKACTNVGQIWCVVIVTITFEDIRVSIQYQVCVLIRSDDRMIVPQI